MKVCYFGSYNREYPRNRILIKGLRQNGVDVVECQNASAFWLRCLKLFWKYLQTENHDIIIVGAMGHANVPLAKILSLHRKKIIFDPFISLYDTAVFDRKEVEKDSIKAKYYYYLDKISCEISDIVITDTLQHAKYFSKEFGIPLEKMRVIYIGADDDVFYPKEAKGQNNSKFIVEFHGSFVPLQGVQYIVEAAKILEKENVIFKIIGKGQTYEDVLKMSKKLNVKNVLFLGWVNYNKIPDYIAESDVCLGIFGETEKAKRVIPNKAFEILAMKKPLITGDSPAVREVLINRKSALLCEMANPASLAEAIMTLMDDRDLRNSIADEGYKLFKEKFTPKKLGVRLKRVVEECVK